jgi:hypothetical protein
VERERERERERDIHIAILPLRHNPNDGGCYTNYIVTGMDCLVRVLFKMIFYYTVSAIYNWLQLTVLWSHLNVRILASALHSKTLLCSSLFHLPANIQLPLGNIKLESPTPWLWKQSTTCLTTEIMTIQLTLLCSCTQTPIQQSILQQTSSGPGQNTSHSQSCYSTHTMYAHPHTLHTFMHIFHLTLYYSTSLTSYLSLISTSDLMNHIPSG